MYVASLRASAHQPLWAVQHLDSSPNMPDILRINHADGLPYVVIAELLQGVIECSVLQRQGASDRYIVPNPCHSQLSVKHLHLFMEECWEDVVLLKK